jgi:predicted nucleic acid-binding protein
VKAVVDTNVVAYLLLGTAAFVDESRECFERVVTPLAPAHWEAELANVVWMAVKAGVLSAADGPARLGLARRLGIESIATSTLSQGALSSAPSNPGCPFTTPSLSSWPRDPRAPW